MYSMLVSLLYLSLLRTVTSISSLEPYDLRADSSSSHYTASTTPLLSWRLRLAPGTPPSTPAVQTSYRILASASAASVASGTLYDSGWVPSNATLNIPYGGTGLTTPGDTLYWSVLTKDGTQAQSPLSTPMPLTLAPSPSRAGDWGGATWITHNVTMQGSDCECYDPSSNPVPIMRIQFTVPPTASVAAAHLFVAGLGYHEVFLSGRRVGSASSEPLPDAATGFGLGFGEPGASLGDDVLNPPWTTFAKRVLFSAYNVTALLAQGGGPGSPQTLGILVGRGMWDPYPMRFFGSKEFNFRESLAAIGRPQAIALLHLTLSDGSVVKVVTNGVDGSSSKGEVPRPTTTTTSATATSMPSPWVWAPGPLTSNNIYIGEGYDARLGGPIAGWMSPAFNASGWSPVFAANPYRAGPLHLNPAPPTRITALYPPTSLTSPLPGLYILAFPHNIAGFLSVRGLTGPPGTPLRFTYAEILNATSGDIDPGTNLAGCIGCWPGIDAGPCAPVPALETDTLTLGSGTSTPTPTSYTAKFTWHAFRYVRVEGWVDGAMGGPPHLDQFRALQVHVDNTPAGTFASANPQHAAVDALVSASFRANWAGGIQSDCPGRERLGYGGDMLAGAEAAVLQFDVGAFYGKRVDDYGDAGGPGGELPETAPFMGIDTCVAGGGGNMQWGSALTELQRLLLHYHGDVALAGRTWEASVAWLSYLNASSTPEGLLANGLVDGAFSKEEGGCGTMAVVFGTAFFARQCANLALIAEVLGKPEVGAPWAARGEQVKAAFQAAFFDPTTGLVGLPAAAAAAAGNITVPSAADAQVWALGTGVFASGSVEESRAAAVLAARLAANGSTAYLGAFATSFFYSHAHEWVPPGGDPSRGLVDAAYAALNTVEFPGYGFMLANGAVALWEHLDTLWDHSSRNHAWYGSVAVFLRRVMGGIGPAPGARGFDRVLIKPIPQRLAAAAGGGGGVPPPPRYANTTYESTRGPITTLWRLFQEGPPTTTTTFTVRVLLPPNVDTTVELSLAPPIEGGGIGGG